MTDTPGNHPATTGDGMDLNRVVQQTLVRAQAIKKKIDRLEDRLGVRKGAVKFFLAHGVKDPDLMERAQERMRRIEEKIHRRPDLAPGESSGESSGSLPGELSGKSSPIGASIDHPINAPIRPSIHPPLNMEEVMDIIRPDTHASDTRSTDTHASDMGGSEAAPPSPRSDHPPPPRSRLRLDAQLNSGAGDRSKKPRRGGRMAI